MKLFSFVLLAAFALTLASCETTREITLNADGSGNLVNTIDMSSIIGIAKMSGQAEQMDKAKMDTTISLSKMVDSIPDLSATDKAALKNGTLSLLMNSEDEKFITKISFPFTEPAQVTLLNKLSGKVVQDAMKKKMAEGGEGAPPMGEEGLPEGSIDDYFTVTYGKNKIEKVLNAEKYAGVEEDKGMQGLKEITGQGLPMTNTIIINLPRPATKTTGKNLKLSDDKKKVTITEAMDDFFDDGKNFEFSIEY